MTRQLRITDQEAVVVIDDLGPGPVVAKIQAIDEVRLSRADVRAMIAFLEALDS